MPAPRHDECGGSFVVRDYRPGDRPAIEAMFEDEPGPVPISRPVTGWSPELEMEAILRTRQHSGNPRRT